jgi:3-mercaptopyruvate sulfurtransferase SseA
VKPFWLLVNGIATIVFAVLAFMAPSSGQADPSKYPEFAQQTLPKDVPLILISVDEMAKEVTNDAKPLIIDVRTPEEFREAHILGAVSAPLGEFRSYLKSIPRNRLTILY